MNDRITKPAQPHTGASEARVVRRRKSSIVRASPPEGSAVVDADLMATLHTTSLAVGPGGLLELSVRDTRAFADAFLKPKSVNRRLRETVRRYRGVTGQ